MDQVLLAASNRSSAGVPDIAAHPYVDPGLDRHLPIRVVTVLLPLEPVIATMGARASRDKQLDVTDNLDTGAAAACNAGVASAISGLAIMSSA